MDVIDDGILKDLAIAFLAGCLAVASVVHLATSFHRAGLGGTAPIAALQLVSTRMPVRPHTSLQLPGDDEFIATVY